MNFKYKARDKYGKAISGIMSGNDKNYVAKHLSAIGYVPISIEESKEGQVGLLEFFASFSRAVKPEELSLFTRQLLTLQKAGISLLSSLNVLEKQTRNKYFKDIIKELIAHVEGGLSLSEAMAKYPKIFDEFYVNMIKAGEASGLLDEILERLAEFSEKETENRFKIKAAMRYPLITLCALFGAFLIVVTFVIPKFASIFSQFKTKLPLPTRILMGLSAILKGYWYILIIFAGILYYLFYRYINTKKGRYIWDSFKLKVPIFGPLISMFVMARFARTMSILIRSGLPILQILDMVSRTVGNAVVARTIDNIAINVRDGKGISEPMRLAGIFPPIVVQMVAIGEDTGKIDELLLKVSEYYDQQVDYAMKNLTTLIEPLFIVILGVMVLTMALSIFLPMWNLITFFRH